jgi:Major Facilitator Superfamily
MIPIPYALDALNFLASDVRNLFGPFVNVFLVTSRYWSQTDVVLHDRRPGRDAADRDPRRRRADSWGRRPIVLIAFAVLPIRAALSILSDNAFWLIGVQLLDGVGAGIYGALTPLVIADIMRGSGRYNLAQGAVATTMGIGASLSALFAGEMVDHFGYSASFLALGAAAAVACVVFALFMLETRDERGSARDSEPLAIEAAAGE